MQMTFAQDPADIHTAAPLLAPDERRRVLYKSSQSPTPLRSSTTSSEQ